MKTQNPSSAPSSPADSPRLPDPGPSSPSEIDRDMATEYTGSGHHPGNAHAQLGAVPIQPTDNLDETVLGSAAVGNPNAVPPEVADGTGALTEWDTPADAEGTWKFRPGRDDEMLDAEQLVEAGIEEADREQRVSADQDAET